MEHHLAALGANPRGTTRTDHLDALVDCPLPLAPLLLGRMPEVSTADRWVALEVMTRRYYRMRALGELDAVSLGGNPMLCGAYDDGSGTRVQVLTTTGPIDDLGRMVAAAAALGGRPLGPARRSCSTSTPGRRTRSATPTNWLRAFEWHSTPRRYRRTCGVSSSS